jgi:hypothetical protein
MTNVSRLPGRAGKTALVVRAFEMVSKDSSLQEADIVSPRLSPAWTQGPALHWSVIAGLRGRACSWPPKIGVADEVTRQGLTLHFDARLLTSSATFRPYFVTLTTK